MTPLPPIMGEPYIGARFIAPFLSFPFRFDFVPPMLSHADNTEDPAPQALPPSAASSNALRTQRLSPDEARAVIDLWQAEQVEQTGLTDRPAVPDVAEGLDLSVEDVQQLLAEVRTRRETEARLLAHEQELAEIRLAEEQRKLAEIQRQRAQLRREQADSERRGVTSWRRPEPHSLPPKRLSRRLPQRDIPGWQGAAAFSPEDEAAELLAEQGAEAKSKQRNNRAFWQLVGFMVFVTLSCYVWAVVASSGVSSQPCSPGTHHPTGFFGSGPCVYDGSQIR